MALKDWKKIGNSFIRIKKKQGEVYKISLWKPKSRTFWKTIKYFYNPNKSFQPTSTQSHDNKTQAIKFAKAYMRKH